MKPVVIAVAALAAVTCGGAAVATATFVFPGDPITRPPEASRLGEKVAVYPRQRGRADAAVYLARSSDGHVCVSSTAGEPDVSGSGCDRPGDPLGGRPFMLMFGYDGGPAIDTVTEARLFGLADATVARLEVEMSDGSIRALHLSADRVAQTPYRVFADRVAPADLRARVTPVAVIAYDVRGTEIARQPTGFG